MFLTPTDEKRTIDWTRSLLKPSMLNPGGQIETPRMSTNLRGRSLYDYDKYIISVIDNN